MTTLAPVRIWVAPDELLDVPALLKRHFPGAPSARILRRAIDARHRKVRIELWVALDGANPDAPLQPHYPDLGSRCVLVVGAGPAGLFAAHALRMQGVKPIVLERGSGFPERHLEARSLRLWGQYQSPAYTSGLGGAGTYSDGKLYTRKKSDAVKEVLRLLAWHGRDPDLTVDTHPHVGSNRLPVAISRMVESLSQSGSEFRFGTCVSQLVVRQGRVCGVTTLDDEEYLADAVILAPGNSARTLFFGLHAAGVAMQPKPFAVGLRLEHPRTLIDQIRYGVLAGHPALGAARYSFAFTRSGRGVYSFCMCPGGHLIPTPPEEGHLAVNGMSHSLRGSHFSNAAVVVSVESDELTRYSHAPFHGIGFQQHLERQTFELGGSNYHAPAQRLTDFLKRVPSVSLPDSSYLPGLRPGRLDGLLPPWMVDAISWGIREAEASMPGFLTSEALLVGTETLTSCPIQLIRTPQGESVSHPGLYPVGEGSGWGGGITTSAADGLEVGRFAGMALRPGSVA